MPGLGSDPACTVTTWRDTGSYKDYPDAINCFGQQITKSEGISYAKDPHHDSDRRSSSTMDAVSQIEPALTLESRA